MRERHEHSVSRSVGSVEVGHQPTRRATTASPRSRSTSWRALLVLLAISVPGVLRADIVVLENGSTVTGEIIRISEREVVLRLDRGTITYRRTEVREILFRKRDAETARSTTQNGAPATEPRWRPALRPGIPKFHAEDLVDLSERVDIFRGPRREPERGASPRTTASPDEEAVRSQTLLRLNDIAERKPPSAHDTLVDFLRSNDPEIFRAAALALARLGDPRSVETLESQLLAGLGTKHAEDPRVLSLIEALGEARRPSSIATLSRVAKESEHESVRGAAAWHLGRFGKTALTLLSELSSDPSALVREASAYALGQTGTRESIALLETLATDASAGTRLRALEALREQREVRVVAPFTQALRDEVLAAFAAETLGSLRATEAVGDLVRLLQSKSGESQRVAAAQALGRIGERKAIGPLIGALDPSAPSVAAAALEALNALAPEARLGDNRAAWQAWHRALKGS